MNIDIGLLTYLKSLVRSGADLNKKSLIEYANPSIVRMQALIESDLTHHEEIQSIMQTALSTSIAIYAAAASIAASGEEARILTTLSKLNPDVAAGRNFPTAPAEAIGAAMEANALSELTEDTRTEGSVSNRSLDLHQMPNLAVGREMEVAFGKSKVVVSVALSPVNINSSVAVNALTGVEGERDGKMRRKLYRSGLLSLSELVFCTDLLDSHGKTLGKDSSGTYEDIQERRDRKQLVNFLLGNVNVARASSVIIVKKSTADEIARKYRGDMDEFKTREKFFKDSLGMILITVDERRDRVTIYLRSRKDEAEFSLRELRSRGSKDDFTSELLRTINTGAKAPSF